jgi:hypothetical protein
MVGAVGRTDLLGDERRDELARALFRALRAEVRVELQDVGGRTKMVMTHSGIRGDSPGAAGWTMALDKLAAHVEAHSHR